MPKQQAPLKCRWLRFWPMPAVCRVGVIVLMLMPGYPRAAQAISQDPSDLCVAAAQSAAEQTGVPVAVLRAITIVETGRSSAETAGLQPWPWAFNHAGDGHWFNTADEAKQQAATLIDKGVRNIDLGCFQLNLRWHSKGFSSLDAMFDPEQNALYAAEFLKNQYAKTGNWSEAAGAYHSLTPEFAQEYRLKFDETLASLEDGPSAPLTAPPVQAIRANNFPLLLSGARGNGGSLVPRLDRVQPLIGAP